MAAAMEDSVTDVCVACLAINTVLWPLGQYAHLFKLLLGKDYDQDNIEDTKTFLCNDCQDMFHKIQIFQQKIQSSQDILLMKLKEAHSIANKVDLKSEYDKYKPAEFEIEIDYLKSTDCKDEPFDNDSLHFDMDESVTDEIKQEPEDDTPDFKIGKVKEEKIEQNLSQEQGKKYYRQKLNVSYKIFSGLELIKRKYRYYSKLLINKDVKVMDDETRLAWSYRNKKFKCRTCVVGFKESESLQKHIQNKHSESIGPFACDICETRAATKEALKLHVRSHYYMHECVLCAQTFYKKWQMRTHFITKHRKVFECPKCNMIITHQREFNRHYKMMHQRFICDHCGKLYTDRHWFENHILKNHTKFECKPCGKTFSSFKNIDAHNRLLHTTAASESTYCVECDIQFENQVRYKRHIQNSTRHLGRNRKKSANCPDCGKLYACRNNMMNHYRLEHLKVTNYQCQDCSRFFLNSYRLKEHRLVKHEKKGRAKNKFCSYCGRGFSNNRILMYHVRTHTGERPHACAHCSATFAQPFALLTHVKRTRGCNREELVYHVRTHTGERPHACAHCSATFAQPFALLTHVKARHKDAR